MDFEAFRSNPIAVVAVDLPPYKPREAYGNPRLRKHLKCYRSPMVDIKTAVANAIDFAKASLGPERTAGIRLEEIESSKVDEEQVWLITLSNLDTS